MKKIYYCTVGMMMFGVLEEEIIKRAGLFIEANRIFVMQQVPTQVLTPVRGRGDQILEFIIATYSNVTVQCDMISDLDPRNSLYQGIMKGLEEEARKAKPNEN